MARFFEDSEIKGLQPALVEMLDKARGWAGVPFVITSGRRLIDQNEAAGGVKDSAHLTGEAVDLAVPTAHDRLKILGGLFYAGFTRIGVYDRHIHVDVSPTLPQGVCWVGISH